MTLRLALTLLWMALLVRHLPAHVVPPPTQEPLPLATVEVVAFSTHGAPLGPPMVTIFRREGGRNLSSIFHSRVADDIPYGVYRIEAHATGFSSQSQNVRVDSVGSLL